MDNWITVITFVYPHEAHMAKNMLEAGGINTLIVDELTAQVDNFYSNAIGGVKLKVKEKDAEEAIRLLKHFEYIRETSKEGFDMAAYIYKNRKLLIFILASMIIIVMLILLANFKGTNSTSDRLTQAKWCLPKFYYNDLEISTYTIDTNRSIQLHIIGSCHELLVFNKNGFVRLPGINTAEIFARWNLMNDSLIIFPLSNDLTLVTEDKKDVFEGKSPAENLYFGQYAISVNFEALILESKTRKIHAWKAR